MERGCLFLSLSTLLLAVLSVAGCQHLPRSSSAPELNRYAVGLAHKGLWQEADYYWQHALKRDPQDPKILNNLAVSLERKGDFEGASKLYEQALKLSPNSSVIRRNSKALGKVEERRRSAPAGDQHEKK